MSAAEKRANVADRIGWAFVAVGVGWLLDALARYLTGQDFDAALAAAIPMFVACVAVRAHGEIQRLQARIRSLEVDRDVERRDVP